jgi:hypothetical protein
MDRSTGWSELDSNRAPAGVIRPACGAQACVSLPLPAAVQPVRGGADREPDVLRRRGYWAWRRRIRAGARCAGADCRILLLKLEFLSRRRLRS